MTRSAGISVANLRLSTMPLSPASICRELATSVRRFSRMIFSAVNGSRPLLTSSKSVSALSCRFCAGFFIKNDRMIVGEHNACLCLATAAFIHPAEYGRRSWCCRRLRHPLRVLGRLMTAVPACHQGPYLARRLPDFSPCAAVSKPQPSSLDDRPAASHPVAE